MATYTFIVNYKGGIYIRQVSARNILQACRVWANEIVKEQDIQDLNSAKFIKSFNVDLDDLPPVSLENTPNVWCFTVGSGRNFMIAKYCENRNENNRNTIACFGRCSSRLTNG